MTTIEVIPELEQILELSDSTGSGTGHECCCRRDAFLCGAPYHPEMDASIIGGEPDCRPCAEAVRDALCNSGNVTHTHCPLDNRICPFTPDGRRVIE